MKLKDLLQEIFFPAHYTCDACGLEIFDGWLCPACQNDLHPVTSACPTCGRQTVRPEICYDCKARAPFFDRGVSAFEYRDTAGRLILKYKNGSPYLKKPLSEAMIEKVKTLPPFDLITYVPMTQKAERKRGYNQSFLLAQEIGKAVDRPVLPVLEKVKTNKEQKSLSKQQRAENLKGCFHVHLRKECKGKRILLVDDVLTTGATAETIALLLKGADAKAVYVATIASVSIPLFSDKPPL